MDGNRFDRLTKTLTAGRSRRQVLTGLVGALGLAERTAHASAAPAKKHKKAGATCQVQSTADAVVTTVAVKLQKLRLATTAKTPRDPQQDQTTTTVIRRGRALLLQVEQTIAGADSATVSLTYGQAFTGIRKASFTIAGSTVNGAIDGRAIVPYPVGSPPATLQFQDGQPAPEMQVSKQIAQQLGQILARAQAAQLDCTPAPGQASQMRRRHGAASRHVRPQDTGEVLRCLSCKAGCASLDAQCGWAAASACNASLAIPFVGPALYGACVVVALASCIAAGFECMQSCRRGRDCCPVLCGTIPDLTCCQDGEPCLTFGTGIGVCCNAGDTPCHETSCCAPFESCRDDGGCCRAGTRPCGRSNCCKDTETCLVDGSCCPTGQVCAGVCCPPGQSCDRGRCAVLCNPTFQVTCPNEPGYPICCDKGTVCCKNGQCCPNFTPVCCGNSCCFATEECCPDNVCRTNCIR